MKKAYRMFRRKNRPSYYIQNNHTGDQRSLNTADRKQAERLLHAANEAREAPALNIELGKLYITHGDPQMATRTWQDAMDELCSYGVETSQTRYRRELKSKTYDIIRTKPIVGTTAEDLNAVLKRGGSITNNYLRRLHNLALDNGWIKWHIIAPKKWAKPTKAPKRAITYEEHQRIITAEQSVERRHYYEMLWQIGAAQTDGSLLTAEMFDWKKRVLTYQRKKSGVWCSLAIGTSLEALLKKLPSQGFLFPTIAKLRDKDRASLFWRRCRLLDIKGVSLHSYRYSWAERAYVSGYPERYAQAALGHKSRAIHHTYARKAQVVCPALENIEDKVILFTQSTIQETPERKIA